ncbi:MAG: response regulator transcription factor [Anaerolineaceae bacterium]|nr:response regulator transcription factor [Anaerolineaceae bacterium]
MSPTRSRQTIRVLLVDDHDMVRRGLSVFLQAFDDLELIGEARDGFEALSLCGQLKPDVILMDMVMPRMNGVEAAGMITKKYPDIRIIAITSFEDDQMVKAALQAGATSYLHKNVSIDELGEAIRKAWAGIPTLSTEAAQALIHSATTPTNTGLTNRELEVLHLMVAGQNNPEIAAALGVSRSTIKTHVSNILAKLGVSSRLEAVKFALERRLFA